MVDRERRIHECWTGEAFRAPGFPAAAWSLEQMMDMLAEKIGMDPVEFRLKNFTESARREKTSLFQRRIKGLPD